MQTFTHAAPVWIKGRKILLLTPASKVRKNSSPKPGCFKEAPEQLNIKFQACTSLVGYISEAQGYTSLKKYNPAIQLRNPVFPNILSCYYCKSFHLQTSILCNWKMDRAWIKKRVFPHFWLFRSQFIHNEVKLNLENFQNSIWWGRLSSHLVQNVYANTTNDMTWLIGRQMCFATVKLVLYTCITLSEIYEMHGF